MNLTFKGDYDLASLNKELTNVLGPDYTDWHLIGFTGSVIFSSIRDYPVLVTPEVPAVPEILAVPEVPAQEEVLYDSTTDPVTEYKPAVAYVPAVPYQAPVPAVPAVYGPDPFPVIEAHIANAKTRKQNIVWEKIKLERDRRQSSGVKVGNNWFQSDVGSRIQQLGLVLLGANIPQGTQWKVLGGAFVPMTQTLAGQVFAATAMSDMAIFAVAETHKAAMLALPDPTNYDYTTGWPATYTGA